MSTWDDLLTQLKKEVGSYAEKSWNDLKDAFIKDGIDFLSKAEDDIKNWAKQLAEQKITAEEFKWLLKAKKDLAELTLLKERGLAKAALEKFQNGLIDTVISSVTKII